MNKKSNKIIPVRPLQAVRPVNKSIDHPKEFGKLVSMMKELRAKCPWDKKQTFESLRHLTIEETYELTDAIIEKDILKIKAELGDLLLHIVFYSRLAEEKKAFTISDVITGLCKKLIHRHPHIYGDVKVSGSDEVKHNWEKLKLKEGKKSVMDGVPVSLPAMVKAMRIQEKARASGFDWEKSDQVWDKVVEEMNEFRDSLKTSIDKKYGEFGDLLFSLINYARFTGIDPELALEKTNKKFLQRFRVIEMVAEKSGKSLKEMTLAEMDAIWEKAKSLP